MAAPVNIRATDRSDFSNGNRRDFVVRKRGRGLTAQQVYSLALAALTVVIGVTILVYNDTLLGSILCVAVGTAMLLIAKQNERAQRLLQATEFLNALFASALGAGHKFCMIAKQDGEIVYLDRSFQAMFPDMVEKSKRTIDDLLSIYHASDANRNAILAAIKQDSETKLTFQIEGGKDHAVHSIEMLIEPILRPSGFCLLRGRIA